MSIIYFKIHGQENNNHPQRAKYSQMLNLGDTYMGGISVGQEAGRSSGGGNNNPF